MSTLPPDLLTGAEGWGERVRLFTGDHLGVTEPAALLRLLDLQGQVELRIFQSAGTSFHPKAYILFAGDGEGAAFDTQRPEVRRILFTAHWEELLQ